MKKIYYLIIVTYLNAHFMHLVSSLFSVQPKHAMSHLT